MHLPFKLELISKEKKKVSFFRELDKHDKLIIEQKTEHMF